MIKTKTLIKDVMLFLALLLFHVLYIYFGTTSFGEKSIHFEKIQWNPAVPAEQGIHPKRLNTVVKYIESRLPAARSLIIIKNGKTILEKYFWKSDPEKSYYLHSLNSAVLELLIGIAVKENLLTSVDAPLADFFPTWFAQQSNINVTGATIDSLLQIQGPLLWGNDNPEYWQLFYSHDKIPASLNVLFANKKKNDRAANFAATFLLTEIVRQVSDIDVFTFAHQHLLAPMGITTYENDPVKQNPTQSFIGFKLKTLDLAKLSYLIMHEGAWEGRQLLHPDWFRKRMNNLIPADSDKNLAGSWQYRILNGKKNFVSRGEGGQFIVLYPEQDMVVTVSSNSKFPLPQVNGYDQLFTLVTDAVLKQGEDPEKTESYVGDPTKRAYYEPNFVFATEVPEELLNFFRDFAKDIATNDIGRVIYHYAKGYEKDDDTFRSVPGNWYKMYAGGTCELESVEINKVRIEKNRAYLRGMVKYSYANMQQGLDGWFPIESLIKLRGRWQWFGSPAYAAILDRNEYFDAVVSEDISAFIDKCGNAFIGGYWDESSCFAKSFSYKGADKSQFSGIIIPFLKERLKVKLHLTRVEPNSTGQLVEGYFETDRLGEIRLPPGMNIINENGAWKWLGDGKAN